MGAWIICRFKEGWAKKDGVTLRGVYTPMNTMSL